MEDHSNKGMASMSSGDACVNRIGHEEYCRRVQYFEQGWQERASDTGEKGEAESAALPASEHSAAEAPLAKATPSKLPPPTSRRADPSEIEEAQSGSKLRPPSSRHKRVHGEVSHAVESMSSTTPQRGSCSTPRRSSRSTPRRSSCCTPAASEYCPKAEGWTSGFSQSKVCKPVHAHPCLSPI